MEKTMSVYDKLAMADQCFQDLGDGGRTLQEKLVPAMREWVETLWFCAEVDERIQAIAAAANKGASTRDAIIIARLERARRQLESGAAA